MSYRNQKLAIVIFLISSMGIFVHGCSREVPENTTFLHSDSYDFLDNLGHAEITTSKPDYVTKSVIKINDDLRFVLFEHPNSEVVFRSIPIKENAKLKFGFALDQKAWDKAGDGVLFEISISRNNVQDSLIFSQYIDPKNNVGDRKWFDEEIDLSGFEGKTVSFIFKTTSGPKGNPYFDWAGWASPQLTSVTEKTIEDVPIILEETKYDLMRKFSVADILTKNRIKESRIKVNNDLLKIGERRAIVAYPPSEFSYQLTLPDKAFLMFGVGVATESANKDVIFEAYVDEEMVFSKHIKPPNKTWFDNKIDLSNYGRKNVKLRFKTLPGSQKENNTALVMAGWSSLRIITEGTTVQRNSSSKDRPNIILIVIDTQRADHLTCYGYERDTSPHLNNFAKQAMVFDNAISQSSWTWPATASILTGLFPYSHGVINKENSFLESSIITLPEILQEHHLTTFAISANTIISKDDNFHQGFETFIEMPSANADVVNETFLAWLENNKHIQFFAYLHYMDPHSPYAAPGAYFDKFDRVYLGENPFGDGRQWLWNKPPMTQRVLEYGIALYDGEVQYWDSQFGHFLEQLKTLNILEKSIIVITSDHGEEFLEHGRLGHTTHLYDELIKVPLIIWSPEIKIGERIKEQVQTVDIYPTLCRMLGIEIPKDIQGTSLFPWSELKSHNRYAYSQTGAQISSNAEVMRTSVRTNDWKLIFTPVENTYELYSLSGDKEEKHNLFGSRLIGAELKKKLEEWILITNTNVPTSKNKMTKKNREKLRSLGYIK